MVPSAVKLSLSLKARHFQQEKSVKKEKGRNGFFLREKVGIGVVGLKPFSHHATKQTMNHHISNMEQLQREIN